MNHPFRILVLNGPNINLLGLREPEIYGKKTYNDLLLTLSRHAEKIGVELICRQSNHEGVLIDEIQAAYGVADGIVFNPGGYTHTSIALADALAAVRIPTVEVHITNIDNREEYRKISYIRPHCLTVITGHGIDGYCEALDLLLTHLEEQRT